MKLWILLAIALLFLFWGVREGFNPATQRPEKTDASLRRAIEAIAGTTSASLVDNYIGSAQKFYDTKYLPEKKTPEASVVDSFVASEELKPEMSKDMMKRIIDYVFLSTNAPPPSTGTSASGTGTTTGGTTGGSSAPNSRDVGDRSKQVFGPTFTGRGEADGVVPSDSSKLNRYPELLGGGGNARRTTEVEGTGSMNPLRNLQLPMDGSLPSMEGALPTTAGLGADENSRFLPFSRQPGDMEVIPDPFRVSQQFSAANLASKTEPLPFLTDFSAFQS